MRKKIIRDPIHEYISLSKDELCLVDSPWFQRLRHCSQNGPTKLVYPSIFGTRFEHSLGVMHVSTKIFESVLDKGKYRANPEVVDGFIKICKRDLKHFLESLMCLLTSVERLPNHRKVSRRKSIEGRMEIMCQPS